MAMGTLEFSTRLTREDVAGVVEALIEGLKDGALKVHKSGETLELEVPRVIDLEVEASEDEERAEFSITVSWRTNRAENPDTEPGSGANGKSKERFVRSAGQLRTGSEEEDAELSDDFTTLASGKATRKKEALRVAKVSAKEAEASVREAAKAAGDAARSLARAAGKGGRAAALAVEDVARKIRKEARSASGKAAEALSEAAEKMEAAAKKAAGSMKKAAANADDKGKNGKRDAVHSAEKSADVPGGFMADGDEHGKMDSDVPVQEKGPEKNPD